MQRGKRGVDQQQDGRGNNETKRSKNQTPSSGAMAGSGAAGTVRLIAGGVVVEVEVQVLRENSEFFDRLFAGRDMQPTATTNADGSISINREGGFLAVMLLFFKSKDTATLPKDDSSRRKLLEEARYYEARELVSVLSGQLDRAATVGAENVKMSAVENRIRNLFAQHRGHSELTDPILTMTSIYGDDGTFSEQFDFKHFQTDPDFAIILRNPEHLRKADGPSVVPTLQEFKARFQLLTERLFPDSFDWSNVFIAGGCVLRTLVASKEFPFKRSPLEFYNAHGCIGNRLHKLGLYRNDEENIEDHDEDAAESWHTSRSYEGSDIDVFLYGLSQDQANKKLSQINDHLHTLAKKEEGFSITDITFARSKGSFTFAVGDSSVQVILRLYASRPEVLMSFDLDSCAVGYDGTNVWALSRARRALNGRFNLIDETRPNVKYESRLYKYALRDFAVGVPGMLPDRSNVRPSVYAGDAAKLSGVSKLLRAEVLWHSFSGEQVVFQAQSDVETADDDPQVQLLRSLPQTRNIPEVKPSRNSYGGDTRYTDWQRLQTGEFTLQEAADAEQSLRRKFIQNKIVFEILGSAKSWYDTWRMGVGVTGWTRCCAQSASTSAGTARVPVQTRPGQGQGRFWRRQKVQASYLARWLVCRRHRGQASARGQQCAC